MGTHALITTYKKTESTNLPLILVVGREPNNEGSFVTSTGTYNFDDAPKCAFWNESYAVMGKLCGMTGQELKELCRNNDTSPIAFTDISPILIRNSDPLKKSKRKQISTAQIDKHLQNMLYLVDELGRTTIVVLTGHRHGSLSTQARTTFGYGATQLELAMKFRKIPTVSVPFMFGNNQSQILETIRADKTAHESITSTISAFKTLDIKKAA